MILLESAHWTSKQIETFEDECFRNWLNRIDARIEYDMRRGLGSVRQWRELFDIGFGVADAVAELQMVRDNRAFCGE